MKQDLDPIMTKHLPLKFGSIAIVLLTACTAWYKPGADEEELAADQQRCTDETDTSAGHEFVECMKRAGWHHSHMSPAVPEPEAVSPDRPKITGQQQQVGGWYQYGVETEKLQDAKAQCQEAASFFSCMKARGWRPTGVRFSVEETDSLD